MSVIELRGGLLVEESAIVLACSLEARGHVMTAEFGSLFISHPETLRAEDRAAIPPIRQHLLAIAGYQAPALP